MISLPVSREVRRWSNEVWHAAVILMFSICLSVFLGEFTFLEGSEALYKGLLRFFRIAGLLCLPPYLLSAIFGKLGTLSQKMQGAFIQIREKQDLEFHRVKHWLLRPFQGIGIGLLFGAKLLSVLQPVTGSTVTPPAFMPTGQFQLGRFLLVVGVTVFLSVLLSALWTLDDLGIRYFNRQSHEIRMIGKYAGTFLPALFGFYGIFNLFSQFHETQALFYLLQVLVILYPPFTVFTVFHIHFVQKRAEILLDRLLIDRRK